jgi:hypothetical protein
MRIVRRPGACATADWLWSSGDMAGAGRNRGRRERSCTNQVIISEGVEG